MKKLRTEKFVAILLVAISCQSSAGIYRARYDSYINSIAPEIYKILIEHEVCIEIVDCRRKDMFFLEPEKDGLHVHLYDANDMSVVLKVANKLYSFHKEKDYKFSIKFYAYKERHKVNFGYIKSLFVRKEVILTMTIEENS